MKKRIFEISLFGKLQISEGNESMDLTQCLGKLLVSVFEMIAYHRSNPLSKEVIMDTFWEDSDNPRNVMNYTIFRLRSILKKESFLKDAELIVTKQNCYMLNPEHTYEIDCEIFEHCYSQIKKHIDTQNLPLALRMFAIYQGDLYDNGQSIWTIKTATYYRTIYQEVMDLLCQYYTKEKQYEEVLNIASHAVSLHQDNEEAYYHYLNALIKLEYYEDALVYYNKVSEFFENSLGVPLNHQIKRLYHVIQMNNTDLLSIDEAQSRLTIIKKGQALYCDYSVFEYMYNYFLRECARSKETYYLIMFSIQHVQDEHLDKVSDRMCQIIKDTLRSSDVFTNLNKEQYLVLLSCKTLHGVDVAAKRVVSAYQQQKIVRENITIEYHVEKAVVNHILGIN